MIPRDRIEHIASTFGLETFGLSDIAIFDRIANQAGINVNLDRSQKLTVLRRLGGKKKWAKYSFVDLVNMVMTRDQRKLLSRRSDQASRRAKAAQRAMVRDTLHQPVTRLASQPEHLTVLAGLPASHFYASVEWKATRADVLRLSAYRCEWCGATAKPCCSAAIRRRPIMATWPRSCSCCTGNSPVPPRNWKASCRASEPARPLARGAAS